MTYSTPQQQHGKDSDRAETGTGYVAHGVRMRLSLVALLDRDHSTILQTLSKSEISVKARPLQPPSLLLSMIFLLRVNNREPSPSVANSPWLTSVTSFISIMSFQIDCLRLLRHGVVESLRSARVAMTCRTFWAKNGDCR